MVTKILPIQRVEFANNNQRSATDGARKKVQDKTPFKEIFAREMANAAKSPAAIHRA